MEPPTAKFALRLALFELDKLIKDGMTQEQFERTREFLGKYVNVLTQTKRAELGYAIDSLFYGINPYNEYLKAQLAKLTLADVNRGDQALHPHGPPGDRGGDAQRRGVEAPTGERRCLADDLQFAQAEGDHRGRQAGGEVAARS